MLPTSHRSPETTGPGLHRIQKAVTTVSGINLDARLTASQIAQYLGVSKQLVNYWRTSGKLTPDANRTYRLGDAMAVEHATWTSKTCSRRQRTTRTAQAAAA